MFSSPRARNRPQVQVIMAFLGVMVGACGLFLDIDALTAGRDGDDTIDGGSFPKTPDVFRSDSGPSFVPTEDGGFVDPPVDSGTEGGPPAMEGAYCTGVTGLLCIDFDLSTSPSDGWTQYGSAGSGSLISSGSGKALRVIAPANGGGVTDYTLYANIENPVPATVDAEFDFRAPSASTSLRELGAMLLVVGNDTVDNVTFLWEVDPSSDRTRVYWKVRQQSSVVAAAFSSDMDPVSGGAWHHVKLHFDKATTRLRVSYDGSNQPGIDLSSYSPSYGDSVGVHVGAIYMQYSTPAWTVDYDNVWVH